MHGIYLINPLRHVYIAPQKAPSSYILCLPWILVLYILNKLISNAYKLFLKGHFFLDFIFHKKDEVCKAVGPVSTGCKGHGFINPFASNKGTI